MLLAGLLISYLNRFRNSLLVALPAARRAIRFPIVPFFTAFTSPKILADLYKNDLILLILIFPRPFCVGDFIITKFDIRLSVIQKNPPKFFLHKFCTRIIENLDIIVFIEDCYTSSERVISIR